MVKMKHSNRKGLFKMFKPENVEAAKSNGWVEADKPKPKPKVKKKSGK
jgi:hypothetical protein